MRKLNLISSLNLHPMFMALFVSPIFVSAAPDALLGERTPIAQGNKQAFVGRAYDPRSGDLLYIERYQISFDEHGTAQNSLVEYLEPDGRAFAIKKVSYAASATAPSIAFKDYRGNNEIRVDSGSLRTTVEFKNGDETKISLIASPREDSRVIDAGFDQFLQQNWHRLQNRESVPFAFLAMSRRSWIDFTVEMTSASYDVVQFRIAPQNFFIRMLVDPIDLTYDATTRRLLRFEGITPIEKATSEAGNSRNIVARIEYEYY